MPPAVQERRQRSTFGSYPRPLLSTVFRRIVVPPGVPGCRCKEVAPRCSENVSRSGKRVIRLCRKRGFTGLIILAHVECVTCTHNLRLQARQTRSRRFPNSSKQNVKSLVPCVIIRTEYRPGSLGWQCATELKTHVHQPGQGP